ncbi:uncharacterized protein LTR77_010979 [Saxophila tyrrhenica]|uniref:EGF domain-specific O-linked N-acetylglucosamine transferase n=1 Tax=Saxophila tyrrhenica TaxID=1690608 RepID=A0AAV9NUU1_9PEZI|nr:hypothetical protein LTR77_010979 [Saxophila tyrrhenica]
MLLLNGARLSKGHVHLAAALFLVACLGLYLQVPSGQRAIALRPWDSATKTTPDKLGIPSASPAPAEDRKQRSSPKCDDHLHAGYLRAFVDRATEYCGSGSSANMTCLSHTVYEKTDVLCFAGPARIDVPQKSIRLGCELREWKEEDAAGGIPVFDQFPVYWYNTGPGVIFRDHIELEDIRKQGSEGWNNQVEDHTILVQREGHANTWHSLMEIMSLTMSLDILRETMNPQTGLPSFTDEDARTTQLLILDDHPDGPYFDLWSLYAHKPPVRFSTLPPTASWYSNIIIPLAGSSNPFWQAEWVSYNCGESVLLQTFSQRLLYFYQIANSAPRSTRQLVLTFVDRKKSRRLLQKVEYLEALEARFPHMTIRLVDFAELDLADQIQIAHSTDILVGVHGAGLTHGMFLPHRSAIVEIQPPGLVNVGFDLMAKSLGHRYYCRHGSEHDSSDNTGDWHQDDVFLDKHTFLDVVSAAINDPRSYFET